MLANLLLRTTEFLCLEELQNYCVFFCFFKKEAINKVNKIVNKTFTLPLITTCRHLGWKCGKIVKNLERFKGSGY